MSLVDLIFRPVPTEIGALTLDASVRELHSARSKATRHPVEAEEGKASEVSDHVQLDPLSIKIEGVISGTPAIDPISVLGLIGEDPVKDAHEKLLEMVLQGQIITVVTSLKEYTDMLVESVEVTRDASKGNALYFSATATQITIVTLQETGLDQRPPIESTKAAGGVPAAPAAPVPAAASTSVLSKLVSAIP